MEDISIEQAIVNQIASNFAAKIAQMEVENAILQVKNKSLEQKIDDLKTCDQGDG